MSARPGLAAGLVRLRENMTTLSELAEIAIRTSVDGLERGDTSQAGDVFTLDREIYAVKEKVVRSCIELIALYGPVAGDLRAITASLEIATDLDRIGRYSKDIAEVIQELRESAPPISHKMTDLSRLGDLTIDIITTAVAALIQRDPESVRNIVEHDDAVDYLYDQLFQEIVVDIATSSITPRVGAHYILLDRYFERLDDHAVNIGQHVIYMTTGARPTRSRTPKAPVTVLESSIPPSPTPS